MVDRQVVIRQHNAITQARYDYSACQLDIFFYLLSCLQRNDAPDKEYTIYVKDIEQLTGRQWNYQQMREATADMGSRVFEVEDDQTYQQMWMFQKVEYIKGEGCLEIQLAAPIRPYLFNLKDNFTSYQLQSALKLSSKYAKRIYQLVSQWKDKETTRTYSLDEFKQMLYLKDPKGKAPEQFQNISQLKVRVLDIAVRQVSEHTDLKIDYLLIKKSRAYDAVRFTITRQLPPQPPIPFEQPDESVRIITAKQHLDTLGITQPQLVATVLSNAQHLEQLFKFTYQLKTDKIKATKNPGGLFLKICGLR
ncbi:replication initiation protein [Hymenobacter nivis]|uniref:RepB family plasmid replication initiator protein n=1 Tax=Hymenobacter nivis TaxID=1850093 RepID=A0A502GBZ5_9BACT|nr:replication initiation protein [Hymenobacter nivis]TPG59475.1 RepB family plasmid replication initiator protein [Hymenobacter nivis]